MWSIFSGHYLMVKSGGLSSKIGIVESSEYYASSPACTMSMWLNPNYDIGTQVKGIYTHTEDPIGMPLFLDR